MAIAAGGAGLYTLLPNTNSKTVDSKTAQPPAPSQGEPAPSPALAPTAPQAAPPAPERAAQAVAQPLPAPRALPLESATKPASPAPAAPTVASRTPAKTPAVVAVPAVAPSSASPGASQNGQLGDELALLGQIRKSIQDGESAKALGLLDEYQRRFASPVLAMEAAALRVDALCKTGDKAAANAAAEAFQKAWPASPLARRVSAACP